MQSETRRTKVLSCTKSEGPDPPKVQVAEARAVLEQEEGFRPEFSLVEVHETVT